MALNLDSVFANTARSLMGSLYEAEALKAAIKDGTLATSFTDEINELGVDFFFQYYQANVERTSALVTLEAIFDAIVAVDGADIQFDVSNRNVENIIGDKTLGLMYGLPLFTDIELVNTDVDETYILGGGRNRATAIHDHLVLLGLTHEQALAQQLRVTVVTFSGENADANKSLYIIASNDARTMKPVEIASVKMSAAIGVHFTDTPGILQGIKAGKVDVAIGLGLIAANGLYREDGSLLLDLTSQAWITLAKGFVSALKPIKTELYYTDQTPAMSPKGDKSRYGYLYEKLLVCTAIEDLLNVFTDALETVMAYIELPSDIVRNGVPLLIRAMSEAVAGFELDEFYPDLLPLKVKAVKSVKKPLVTANTALTLAQCDAVLQNEVPCAAGLTISAVFGIKKAIMAMGGYPSLSYTALDAKQINEGKEPITVEQAAAIVAGTEPNDSGLSNAQLNTIAKSMAQAVTVTPIL